MVTGIGFLGAGVIMRDGLSISGLTTAASIWAASAVGVLLGVGFYAAALLMALLCMLSMSMLHRLEAKLPGRSTLEVCLTFSAAGPPPFDELAAAGRGSRLSRAARQPAHHASPTASRCGASAWWRWTARAPPRRHSLAQDMAASDGVASFSIVPVRN